MGVEGRERVKTMETGAQALSGQLGKTIQRLRKAYNLSLSELCRAIGRREVDHQPDRAQRDQPDAGHHLAPVAGPRRLDRARARSRPTTSPSSRRRRRGDTPMLVSDDGKMRLAIIGWIKTVEWLQWYDVQAEPGGVLESEPPPARLGRMPVGARRRVRGRGRRRHRDREGRRDAALSLRPPHVVRNRSKAPATPPWCASSRPP